MVLTYRASYEYLTAEDRVQTIDVVYLANTPAEAMDASVRFWEGRNKALPEWFHEVLCVTLYPYEIGEIRENGALQGGLGFRLFEWKCDNFGGLSLRDFAQYMAQKLVRNAA